ncbi:MAG: aminomethyltransferase family protein [Acidobacteriota bacterium]|nr:aminomethyltransferase family protein [Acidobacteriota bacterium]
MREEEGWLLPASYGDVPAEYETVRGGGAGVIDLSSRGRVEVAGSEAEQFLNGLITNDVKALEVNGWMHAAFPNVQGRLVAATRVLRLSKDRFLFDTESSTHASVLKTLERFTLAGDFRVTDLTSELAHISVQGRASAQVVRGALVEEAARVERSRVGELVWREQALRLIRATHTAEKGFDLFVDAEGASSLWDALVAAGARPVGFDALDILRIEAGIPRYGADVNETNVVLEAVSDDAVSFTKGCYIGQEIIARIRWRGHVAKRLAGLSFDEEGEVRGGDKVITGDKEIGRVTSATFSPLLNRHIALSVIKYDYLAPGTAARVISAERELAARVAELPFVRGSWYENGEQAESSG